MTIIDRVIVASGVVCGVLLLGQGAAMAGTMPGRIGSDFSVPPVVAHMPHATPHLCNIKGTWDEVAGGIVVLKSKKKGTWTYPGSCVFKLTISDLTTTGFDVTATYKGTSCQSFTEVMTFDGCDSVSGTFTNSDGSTGTDSWSKE